MWIAGDTKMTTDFNYIDDDGRLTAVPSSYEGPAANVRIGGAIRLTDREGNSCQAVIEEIADRFVLLRPVWETWSPAERSWITSQSVDASVAPSTASAQLVPRVA
jgi:hypothetical protein